MLYNQHTGVIRANLTVRESFLHSTDSEIRDRIENWRRHYRAAQRYAQVSWYTKPELGEVHEENRIVSLPINMQDAIKLELQWRGIEDQAKKYYLKWQYIVRMQPSPIWRKLKQYGVRIKNYHEHDSFDRLTIEYFERLLSR